MNSDKLSSLEEALPNVIARQSRNGRLPRGLPNLCYTDADYHVYEQDAVFAASWSCIGFGKDVPNPGDVFPVEFAGRPLFLVRDRKGRVRVFHNACRHRGFTLVDAAKNCRAVITCPYHAWSYGLDGSLRATPMVGGHETHDHPDLDRKLYGLKEVRSHVWLDIVFVNLSDDAAPFEEVNAPLLERWREFDDAPLVHCGEDNTVTFDLACNWKLAIENFCEAYHLPWVHPALNSYSPIEQHYNIVEWATFSGQGTKFYSPRLSPDGAQFPILPGLSEKWETGAEYIAVHPNLMVGVHKDHIIAVMATPDGPSRTFERMEIYYFSEETRGDGYETLRKANQRAWEQVFAEDRFAVEGMQKGRNSPGFDGGVFTPIQDPPTHSFHAWIAARLKPEHGITLAAE